MKAHKWEIIIIMLLLAAALIWLAFSFFAPKNAGSEAAVTGPTIETRYLSLNTDGVYHIEAMLPVTLRVQDGRIRFENSVCPDHLCEGFGWISKEGQQAVCMPAGVAVTITPDG